MKRVELPLAGMSYPLSCCKCGSLDCEIESYSEHIALRALSPFLN